MRPRHSRNDPSARSRLITGSLSKSRPRRRPPPFPVAVARTTVGFSRPLGTRGCLDATLQSSVPQAAEVQYRARSHCLCSHTADLHRARSPKLGSGNRNGRAVGWSVVKLARPSIGGLNITATDCVPTCHGGEAWTTESGSTWTLGSTGLLPCVVTAAIAMLVSRSSNLQAKIAQFASWAMIANLSGFSPCLSSTTVYGGCPRYRLLAQTRVSYFLAPILLHAAHAPDHA